MRKPECDCGKCRSCVKRQAMARWRAKHKCSDCGRCNVCRKKKAEALSVSLEKMRIAAEQSIRDYEIRAYGPQAPGSTLDPSHIFSLRESRSK